MSQDDFIMATNDDATACKRYAVQLGYWEDAFLPYFVKSAERKAPEINRGYFARVKGIKDLVDQFIRETDGNCQLVSFGAGFDTLYWRLRSEGTQVKSFIEVDLPGVSSRKVYYIRQRKPLLNAMVNEDEDVRFSASDLHAGTYHLIGADLRNLEDLQLKIKDHLDFSLPTAFLAECVLVYLPITNSSAVLRWIAEKFPTAVFFNYEQVNMMDRFGDIMIDNLKKRCCSLEGVNACTNLRSQEERFLSCNWSDAKSFEMRDVYKFFSKDELDRIEKLEFLDEGELLQQLLQHYCITVALKDDKNQLQLSQIAFPEQNNS